MTTFKSHLTAGFSDGFFNGIATLDAGLVPFQWDVAIGGHGYMIDTRPEAGFSHRSVPLLKQQLGADEAEPGDASLNPEGLWRRSSSSWHKGAGQVYRDHADSDSARFASSKGVDVWTRGRLTLLADTSQAHSSSNTNLFVAASQGYIYYADNQTVKRTDLTSSSNCTGTPAAAVTSIVSGGAALYAAFVGSGVYTITGTSGTSLMATAMTYLGFAKGRLLGARNDLFYDLSTGSAVTVMDHDDSSFVWNSFAEGRRHIYAAGNSSDRGLIYRTEVEAQGTALDVPVVCGSLPVGETVYSLFGGPGDLLFIGTSKGFRVARQDGNGDLDIGPYVSAAPVRCWAAEGQYVYFGWSNYDATSTGVGRIDPTQATGTTQYAYASDLMVTGQGDIVGLGWLNGLVIGASALGIYKPATTLVASGTLESGLIQHRISEEKVVTGGRTSTSGFGSGTLSLSTDGGVYVPVTETGMAERGRVFSLRTTLTRGTTTQGPTVSSTLIVAYVAAQPSMNIFATILLNEEVVGVSTAHQHMKPSDERAFLKSLWQNRILTSFQQGGTTAQVIIEDFEWNPESPCETQPGEWNGSLTLKMKEIL